MQAAEIRTRFLKYFESQGHRIVESSSLVPANDPTLLFTNAGMVQFKDVFLGKDPRPYTRATTSQKCVRAGGKHNDLENVGFTARHHTFFEMLGNFSFGDYFKKEAIKFAWAFIIGELKMPKDRLYVSVFETDDEAAEIWEKQEGIPKDRIHRFGEKDNFWSMGDTGPCGPCSEIFFDRGAKYGCGKATCAMGCDCDRFVEFWNLVFMQFDRDASGKLTPLPKPSVDTGTGLERIALILQDAETNYDTDVFLEIIRRTEELITAAKGPSYERKSESAFSYRVIADHSRATAFLIADGVTPSNEGRGYVLRRIIRRAVRHGRKLGLNGPFLHQTAGFVIDQMKGAYPDLVEKRAFIERATLAEEEQFLKTLERGLALLDDEVTKLGSGKTLSGEIAFKLYDTYGFPLDLTRVIGAERGLGVDEPGFERCMERQRSESRKHWKGSGDEAISGVYQKLANDLKASGKLPKFVGYDATSAEGECVAILRAGELVKSALAPALAASKDSADEGAVVEVVFATTPFYGESGGQVGDRGRVTGTGFEGEVLDVQKPVPELIVAQVRLLRGELKTGVKYAQETHAEIRALTARNHTATHLLQWALREVLGKHVKQAGSLVTPELLRFDFSHFQALTEAELKQVEDVVNAKIWRGDGVAKREMGKDAAVAAGAIAMFGEKYGDVVRVVSVGDYSVELCGGTHVERSSDMHLFKIGSESGIAAGVRRIIAYTSKGAFDYLRAQDQDLKFVRDRLKASSTAEIPGKLERLAAEARELKRTVETLQAKSAAGEVDELLAGAKALPGGGRLVTTLCAPDSQGIKRLRDLAEKFKQKAPDAVVVLGMNEGGKASLLVAVGPGAPKGANAAELLKLLAPMIDGRGGGKPDLAQAGGTKAEGLAEALKRAPELLAKSLA